MPEEDPKQTQDPGTNQDPGNQDPGNQDPGDGGGEFATEEEFIDFFKSGGWRDHIEEDLATDSTLADISNLDDLVKSYVSAQKMIGKKRVAVPAPNADESEWNDFYKSIGRPDEPDLYNLEEAMEGVELVEGLEFDKEYLDNFRTKLHKLGIPREQGEKLFRELIQDTNQSYQEQLQANKDYIDNANQMVDKEWGKSKQERLTRINNALNKVVGDNKELMDAANRLGNDPLALLIVDKFIDAFSEDKIDNLTQSVKTLSPRRAMSKLNTIYNDKNHPYHDVTHPDFDAANKEVEQLMKLAYPSEEE